MDWEVHNGGGIKGFVPANWSRLGEAEASSGHCLTLGVRADERETPVRRG
jgi:hypothetical protein